MKFCSRCETEKPKSEFRKNKAKKDGCSTYCRDCYKSYEKKYYKEKPKRRKAIRDRRESLRNSLREYAWTYLSANVCVDCGEDDIVVLEFDHINPSTKTKEIANIIAEASTVDVLAEEIKKCEVRCANCHRRKTARDHNWRILDYCSVV